MGHVRCTVSERSATTQVRGSCKEEAGVRISFFGKWEIASGEYMAASECTPSGGRLRKVACPKVCKYRESHLFSKKTDASSPCANQFQAFGELLDNY